MARMPTMQDIIVEPPAAEEVVDPMTWFDTPGPFELEIGCGKGGFLLSRARASPHLRLLGIEWANKFFKYAADRMARHSAAQRLRAGNVRVMRTDAAHFVRHHLPPACVEVLHLYHPDPWPKKRHHKRRLIQPDFVEAAIRVIAPGGRWLVQSDHAEYYEQIERLLGARLELAAIEWTEAEADPEPNWQGTNFEIKYAREGRTIHRAAFRRV
jgi:tRNA (guanine-N7-)-methyltransferase